MHSVQTGNEGHSALRQTGHHCQCVCSPANLHFLNPNGHVLKLNDSITRPIFPSWIDHCRGHQCLAALGTMADVIQAAASKRVVIDHHVSSDDLGRLSFEIPMPLLPANSSSKPPKLSESDSMRHSKRSVRCHCHGHRLVSFPSTTARTMKIAAQLIEAGAVLTISTTLSMNSAPWRESDPPAAFWSDSVELNGRLV